MAASSEGGGAWSEAQALIGQPIGRLEGADPVSLADIRRKLEVIAWSSPLHSDEDCARAQGYRAIPSPVTMTRTWALPAYWEPGCPPPGPEPLAAPVAVRDLPGEGDTIVGAGVRLEYFEPLYPGDRVSAVSVLRSVTPKTTRVGRGAFLEVETTFSNQRDEVVAVENATVFRFTRGSSDEP